MIAEPETWHLGDVVTAKDLPVGGGEWVEVNAAEHGGFAWVVWRMEDDDQSGYCQQRAHLIGAAPELLSLVIKAEDWLYRQIGCAPTQEELRAAINKASGRGA